MDGNIGDRCDIDAATLESIVRRALVQPAAELEAGWSCRPLIGGVGEGASLYRMTGTARIHHSSLPWALIMKVIAGGDHGDQHRWDFPTREAFAYGSDLLRALPDGIAAPRCLAVEEQPDGTTRLWLEEVVDDEPGSWSLNRYASAAHSLGRLSGAYLAGVPLPAFPWLSQGWLRGYIEASGPAVSELVRIADTDAFPMVQRLYPLPVVAEIDRLWNERAIFFAKLDQLPPTFCHLDAFRRNLMIRRDSERSALTAIDWSYVGVAAVGEELAPLVTASLLFFEAGTIAPRDLDAACFSAYVDGLREAGWSGDARLVRFGFTAATALRYIIGPLRGSLPGLADSALYPMAEAVFRRPIAECVTGWSNLWPFLFGLADEARALLPIVGPSPLDESRSLPA